jgi:hypothetical protein
LTNGEQSSQDLNSETKIIGRHNRLGVAHGRPTEKSSDSGGRLELPREVVEPIEGINLRGFDDLVKITDIARDLLAMVYLSGVYRKIRLLPSHRRFLDYRCKL